MWLKQVERHPQDSRVLANAAEFFNQEIEPAEELLKKGREVDGGNPYWVGRLAGLYANVIGSSANPPSFSANRPNPFHKPAIAERIKSELEISTDADLVGRVADTLSSRMRLILSFRLKENPNYVPTASETMMAEFALRLSQRAESLGWTRPASAEVGLERVVGVVERGVKEPELQALVQTRVRFPEAIRVGAGVQEKKLLQKVDPVYPPLAMRARIQGTVRFNVTVGIDGSVRVAQVISGHPLLVPAAREAVMQWKYSPTSLNGRPVEVVTQVDVPFSLR
jgi:TonB family protein